MQLSLDQPLQHYPSDSSACSCMCCAAGDPKEEDDARARLFVLFRIATIAKMFAAAMCLSAIAQNYTTFDFSGCKLAFRNLESGPKDLTIELSGFVFDEDLVYSDAYAYPNGESNMTQFYTVGYDAPYSDGEGSNSGDIAEVGGTIGCGRFEIGFGGVYFTLNLIDANFGNGSTYRVLFEKISGDFIRTWVAAPTGSGAVYCWESLVLSSSSGEVHIRDLIRAATGGGSAFTSYKRDRGSPATRIFQLEGALPRYGIYEAALDVR